MKYAPVKAVRLTLLCHALTHAQKNGCLGHPDDGILRLAAEPLTIPSGTQLLAAPEQRAMQTAAWLLSPAQVEPALADCALGQWQGLPLKQLQAEQPLALAQWLEDPFSAPPGGESFAHLCERVGAWLMAFDRPGEWLAITHPWVIRAALVGVLECPLATAQRIDVLPLSRVELSFTGQWRLRLG